MKSNQEKILFFTLLISTFVLRFLFLGHSDYISDEPGTFFYRGGRKDPHMSTTEFMLSQRKGPLQLVVGYIPYFIVGNYNNELAQRLPFALFSFFSIVIFYYAIKKFTGSYKIAFFSAFLFSVNGLVTAYGRIAQYENLNFFFSFAALYFYADVFNALAQSPQSPQGGKKPKSILVSSLLGTAMVCISFYAHWFAAFMFIPVGFIFVRFLVSKNFSSLYKVKVVLANIILGVVLVAPFFIPYFNYMKAQALTNTAYATKTLGLVNPFLPRKDLEQFKLYNPIFVVPLYMALCALGVVISVRRKNWLFVTWLFLVFFGFRIFVKYSGLHFYNIFFPLVVLMGYGLDWLSSRFKTRFSAVGVGVVLVLGFLYLQTFLIFVEHGTEYPWEREKILFWKTPKYTHENNFRHKTGFPHNRYWSEINLWLNEQNETRGESYGYTTNEYPQISKYYMQADFRSSNGFYAVGVKRPNSFAKDYSFPQIKGKETIHRIKDENGDTVVKIYRVADVPESSK